MKRNTVPKTREDAQLLTHHEVAQLLGVSGNTLYNWRYERRGPAWYKMGREVRYRLSDVLKWQQIHLLRVDPLYP